MISVASAPWPSVFVSPTIGWSTRFTGPYFNSSLTVIKFSIYYISLSALYKVNTFGPSRPFWVKAPLYNKKSNNWNFFCFFISIQHIVTFVNIIIHMNWKQQTLLVATHFICISEIPFTPNKKWTQQTQFHQNNCNVPCCSHSHQTSKHIVIQLIQYNVGTAFYIF